MHFVKQVSFIALIVASQAAAQYNDYLFARDADADLYDGLEARDYDLSDAALFARGGLISKMKENRERKKAANALEGKTKKKEPTAAELAAFEQGPAGQYIKKAKNRPKKQASLNTHGLLDRRGVDTDAVFWELVARELMDDEDF